MRVINLATYCRVFNIPMPTGVEVELPDDKLEELKKYINSGQVEMEIVETKPPASKRRHPGHRMPKKKKDT